MIRFLILALVAALAAAPAHATPTPPTIAQLAAFPRMSSFTLSPDGKHLAAIEARGEERVILVWKTDALNEAPTVIGTAKMKFTAVSFIKDDLLAVSLWQPYDLRTDRVTKTFISKLFITDLQGKAWHEPMPLAHASSRDEQLAQARTSPDVLDALPNDPDHILVVNNVGTAAGDVYKVNIHTFKADRVQRSEERVSGYVTDFAGNLRARLRADLVLAAALLHDVGRTLELRRGPTFKATEEGRLLGHVHLGLRLIEERSRTLDAEARAELLHAVAVHHDARSARTAEAAVLYHANQLDATAATRPVD